MSNNNENNSPKIRTKMENIHECPLKSYQTIKTRTFIRTLSKDTLGNETSQAIIRIFDTKYLCFKLFWLICLIASAMLCFYLVAQTILTYLSYPVYTTTTIVHEVPTVFPKVTICNSATAVTNFAAHIVKEINQDLFPGIDIFDQSQMKNLSFDKMLLLGQIYTTFLNRINHRTFSKASRQNLSHPFKDVLLQCRFNSQPCSANDFLWRWDPLYGNCYSFNAGFNSSGDTAKYKESVFPGAVFGLILNIYVGYNDKLNAFNVGHLTNYESNAPVYGLNIFIENNTYLTDGNRYNVMAFDGGTVNYIAVQRKFNMKLPKPYSNCDIDNTYPGYIDSPYYNLILDSAYQYSQELCLVQNLQKQVIDKCNCSIPVCLDIYNVSCKTQTESDCALNYYFTFIKESTVENFLQNLLSTCPLECNSTQFSYTITSQTYKGPLFSALIEASPIFSSDFTSTPIDEATASNKFVELRVYYDSLTYMMSIDSPIMDIVTFLSNIGGTLGLFLGVSVLSVCELVYVMVEICVHVKHKFIDEKIHQRW
jgi:hypothetical protein